MSATQTHCCACCTKPGVTARCGVCKRVYYCNEECQTRDWKSGHKVLCAAETVSGLLGVLEGVTFRLGPTHELPGFESMMRFIPRANSDEFDEIDFHDHGPGLDGLLEDLRGEERVVDGMVFAWLVAVTNSTNHHPEGFCYTQSAWVETNFQRSQEQVPVYFLAPGLGMYQRLVDADILYCGQWLVRDGEWFLGLTDEGPMVLPANKWQEYLARKLTAQGLTGGGDAAKAKIFKDLFLGMLRDAKYYLWPRGLVCDPDQMQQPPEPVTNDQTLAFLRNVRNSQPWKRASTAR